MVKRVVAILSMMAVTMPAFAIQETFSVPAPTTSLRATATLRAPVLPPPLQYRYKPKVPVQIRTFPAAQVNEKCGGTFERALFGRTLSHRDACAVPLRTRCILYMPPNDGSQWWQELLAHETAHCNGWRH